MRVRWTVAARDDLRRHIRFIALDNPGAARLVATRVKEAASGLASNPLMGRAGQVLDTRELVVPRTPFTLAYSVTGQHVNIVAVMHQAPQWPESFDASPP